MELASSVQRKILELTPIFLLESLCRRRPEFVIRLLCHFVNEKNPNIRERELAPRFIAPVPVAKKLSKLSVVAILHLLNQDENLWQMYLAGVGVIPFAGLPYILLELIFDLGGQEGREKVRDIIARSRVTIGGRRQGQILEYFRTDTVLDLFEMLPAMDVRMRLLLSNVHAVALWLTHWDLRMDEIGRPPKSSYWIAQLPGERAYQIEHLMRDLEFRRKYQDLGKEHLRRERMY